MRTFNFNYIAIKSFFDLGSALVCRNIHCICRDRDPEPVPNKTTDFELFQQNKEVRSIADAMEATIRGFYVKNTPVLSISRSSSSNLAYQKQSEILNRILVSTSTEITYTIEEPEHLKARVRVFNLFFVDGLDGFRYVNHSPTYAHAQPNKYNIFADEFSRCYL